MHMVVKGAGDAALFDESLSKQVLQAFKLNKHMSFHPIL